MTQRSCRQRIAPSDPLADCADVRAHEFPTAAALQDNSEIAKDRETVFGNDLEYSERPIVRLRCQNCFGSKRNIEKKKKKNSWRSSFVKAAGDTL